MAIVFWRPSVVGVLLLCACAKTSPRPADPDPAQSTLSAARATAAADGADAVQIALLVRDGAGRALANQSVSFTSDIAADSLQAPQQTDAAGQALANVTSTKAGVHH